MRKNGIVKTKFSGYNVIVICQIVTNNNEVGVCDNGLESVTMGWSLGDSASCQAKPLTPYMGCLYLVKSF
ncbi:MAG TPA: hypothetical protein VKI62_07330, partial [Bacteroidota bacterium]|nr:hypothetical protein [Bacteroidota bacterium]